MPASPTTKWALIARASADAISTIAAGEQAFLGLIDGYLTPWSSGTLASRPAAGKSGRRYLATDVGSFGVEYVDTGVAWIVAPGMVKLDEVTRSSVGLIGFSSIPQGFKSLKVVGSVRSSRGGFLSTGMRCLINANTSTNYQHVGADNAGGTVTAGSAASETFAYVGAIAAAGAAAPVISGVEVLLPGYSRTDNYKTVISTTAGSMSGGFRRTDNAAEHTVTAAITALSFDDDVSGGFAIGSVLSLYGIA
jgi:hypothetical protein